MRQTLTNGFWGVTQKYDLCVSFKMLKQEGGFPCWFVLSEYVSSASF